MDRRPSILIVDDEPLKRTTLDDGLSDAGYRVACAATPLEARRILRDQEFDVILTDIRMPGQDGLSFLRETRQQHPEQPFIVMTAFGSVETAVQAMKLGAFDYLTKPFSTPELLIKLDRLRYIEDKNHETEILRKRLASQNRWERPLIGQSTAMQRLLERVHAVAAHDATILIQGESGVGKSLVARLVHDSSPRSQGPFVTVSCAALPRDLIESELFGHEAGAFTGAVKQRAGRFELAEEGTLFLDDVDDIPLETQVRLLRVLQDHEYERVGGETLMHANVRVIAATKRNLQEMVARGVFREDLFFRLNVVPMIIPPLRDRRDDINLLAGFFLERLALRFGRAAPRLAPDAGDRLMRHPWPGNIRELEHVLEQVMALCPDDEITAAHLPFAADDRGEGFAFALKLDHVERVDLQAVTQAFEQSLVRWALTKADGNLAQAAELLGIPRSTLQYKVQRLKA